MEYFWDAVVVQIRFCVTPRNARYMSRPSAISMDFGGSVEEAGGSTGTGAFSRRERKVLRGQSVSG